MVVNVRQLFSLFQSFAFQFVAGTECAISGLWLNTWPLQILHQKDISNNLILLKVVSELFNLSSDCNEKEKFKYRKQFSWLKDEPCF